MNNFRLIIVFVALYATLGANGGYPSLEQTVRCGVPAPEFKDSIEAAMRRRAPFGHVRLFDGDVAQMLEQEGDVAQMLEQERDVAQMVKHFFFSPGQSQTKGRVGIPDDRRGGRQPGHRHRCRLRRRRQGGLRRRLPPQQQQQQQHRGGVPKNEVRPGQRRLHRKFI